MDGLASTAPEQRLREGTVVEGKFAVEGVLGDGGTGVVYSARRLADDLAVALKVMHPHLAHDRQIRGRFEREAIILRRLKGPHVCSILDAGKVPDPTTGDDLLYLALPRIGGRSLDKVLHEGPLTEARSLALAKEILEALECAHGQDVIHRDLKPANVMIDETGHATVVDFGLSKIVTGGGSGTTNLTTHNMVFGTPEYMSPEQARGDELDGRCDVYALGVLLFEAVTGQLPFRGPSPLAVLTAHLTDEPRRPRDVAKDPISAAFEAVILRALSKDRDNRYPSAGAMRAALERAEVFPDEPEEIRERSAEPPPAPATSADPRVGSSPPAEPPPGRPVPDDAFSVTELSLSPSSPSVSRRSSSSPRDGLGRASSTGDRARIERSTVGRALEPPRTRWTALLWMVIVGLSIAIGVWLGLRR